MKIYRRICPITKKKLTNKFFSLKKFPVLMGVTSQKANKDIFCNMNFYASKNGIIQINPIITQKLLYSKSHGSGTTGRMWKNHHYQFCKFVSNFKIKNAIEIGSGSGDFIRLYNQISKVNTLWHIFEPNPSKSLSQIINTKFHKKFFLKKNLPNINFDGIIHSHVFEHIYQPQKFLKTIYSSLSDDGYHIFSIPNFQKMLDKKYTNMLNFEHTIFLNEKLVDILLFQNGFTIISKKKFMSDHSIFYCTKKKLIKNSYKPEFNFKNEHQFYDYFNHQKKISSIINNKIAKIDISKRQIFIFSAHVFSQYLIAFGLKLNDILNILDNDKHKHNLRLYGTNLFVKSPNFIKNFKNPIIIISHVGVYKNEIIPQLKKINNKSKFI